MRRKKGKGEPYSLRHALGLGVQAVQSTLYGHPMLHAECGGTLEIENCRGILQYDTQKLVLDMGEWSIQIEGDDLMVDSYRKMLMTVRGRVFSIRFGYGGNG